MESPCESCAVCLSHFSISQIEWAEKLQVVDELIGWRTISNCCAADVAADVAGAGASAVAAAAAAAAAAAGPSPPNES